MARAQALELRPAPGLRPQVPGGVSGPQGREVFAQERAQATPSAPESELVTPSPGRRPALQCYLFPNARRDRGSPGLPLALGRSIGQRVRPGECRSKFNTRRQLVSHSPLGVSFLSCESQCVHESVRV